MPDGGAIVSGSFGEGQAGTGGLEQGILARFDASGRTLWQLQPSVTSDYSSFALATTPSGSVILLGSFFRGRFQLPGAPAWSASQRFSSFLAEVDAGDGSVRWARRIGGEAHQVDVAPDGTILIAGQFQRYLRVGQSTLRGEGTERAAFVARFGSEGSPRDAMAYATAQEDDTHGVLPLADGGVALLASSGATERRSRYAIVSFAPDGTQRFARGIGVPAELVPEQNGSSILLAVPSAPRAVSIGGTPYDVVDRVDLVRLGLDGSSLERRSLQLDRGGLLVRSLHAASASGRVLISGALADRSGSESFFEWFPASTPAQAIPAQIGAVL